MRQKTCGKESCKKEQKLEQEKRWREKTPGYYTYFYVDYIIAWREKNPDYQKKWRARKRGEIKTEIGGSPAVKSIRLHLRQPLPNCEIKTEIFRITQTGSNFWVDGMATHVLRDKNADRKNEGGMIDFSP